MMELASWMIKSLPSVRSEFRTPRAVAGMMKPLGSTAFARDDAPHLWHGQTTWGWNEAGVLCALGWDWIEILPGVPVLADPMNMVSNAAFSAEAGEVNTPFSASEAVALNSIVYLLSWQANVLKAVRPAARRHDASLKARGAGDLPVVEDGRLSCCAPTCLRGCVEMPYRTRGRGRGVSTKPIV